MFSRSQIDRLGKRLKNDEASEEDFRFLDEYRSSFNNTYDYVVGTIRDRLLVEPTGRQGKSTTSIRDKLLRESIRLSQMQDIVGCRLVVEDTATQNDVVAQLCDAFPGSRIDDKRKRPTNNYRAVHLIVELDKKPVEIQIRTKLQHLWAQFSEKLSDLFDPAIKYGMGPARYVQVLALLSTSVAELEALEVEAKKAQVNDELVSTYYSEEPSKVVEEFNRGIAKLRADMQRSIRVMIESFAKRKGC